MHFSIFIFTRKIFVHNLLHSASVYYRMFCSICVFSLLHICAKGKCRRLLFQTIYTFMCCCLFSCAAKTTFTSPYHFFFLKYCAIKMLKYNRNECVPKKYLNKFITTGYNFEISKTADLLLFFARCVG